MYKRYRVKFTFLDRSEGVPLCVYRLEEKVFFDPSAAWRCVLAAMDDGGFSDDDAANLARIVVYCTEV